jgi:hypothetical protein
MKWFRSNLRLGSRAALLALTIQFVLSFGHFHGMEAPTAGLSGVDRSMHAVGSASDHVADVAAGQVDSRHLQIDRLDPAGHQSGQQSHDQSPAHPADDCAICVVMALANAMVMATPPALPERADVISLNSASAVSLVDLNSAGVAFQPRAPPSA